MCIASDPLEHGRWRVAIIRTLAKRREGTSQAQWLIYALVRIKLRAHQVRHVRERYRMRFGIESSYRLLEQVRIRTSSPNGGVALLLFGLGGAAREFVGHAALALSPGAR
jgi:putative transposase